MALYVSFPYMRKHGRTDHNQDEIVQTLRAGGAFVQILADMGGGVPDLLCAYQGYWFPVEVKMPTGKLTEEQLRWHELAGEWAPVHIVRSQDDVLDLLASYARRRRKV